MSRYIDADSLKEKVKIAYEDEWNKHTGTTWANAFWEFDNMIDLEPTSDVRENRLGGLVYVEDVRGDYVKCINCGEKFKADRKLVIQLNRIPRYCPMCGAETMPRGKML